jgi:hypothetical protein
MVEDARRSVTGNAENDDFSSNACVGQASAVVLARINP